MRIWGRKDQSLIMITSLTQLEFQVLSPVAFGHGGVLLRTEGGYFDVRMPQASNAVGTRVQLRFRITQHERDFKLIPSFPARHLPGEPGRALLGEVKGGTGI